MGEPVRTCVGCRTRAPKAVLVRVVARGEAVEVDPRQVAPGRGAYLHPELRCLEQALKRRTLGRALRSPIDGQLAADSLRDHVGPGGASR